MRGRGGTDALEARMHIPMQLYMDALFVDVIRKKSNERTKLAK